MSICRHVDKRRPRSSDEVQIVVVLSLLTLSLVAAVLIGMAVNPWAGVALPATLLSVAALIRAVRGAPDTSAADKSSPHSGAGGAVST